MLPLHRRWRKRRLGLSPVERNAFHELGRELSDRLKKRQQSPNAAPDDFGAEPPRRLSRKPRAARNGDAARDTHEGRPILDRLPVGVLVYRLNSLIYANRASSTDRLSDLTR